MENSVVSKNICEKSTMNFNSNIKSFWNTKNICVIFNVIFLVLGMVFASVVSSQTMNNIITCAAGTVFEGETAVITFGPHICKNNSGFQIIHYPVNGSTGSQQIMCNCLPDSRNLHCVDTSENGNALLLQQRLTPEDRFSVGIMNVSARNAGNYLCRLAGDTSNRHERNCTLNVVQKDNRKQADNQSSIREHDCICHCEGNPAIVSLLTFLVLLVLAVLVLVVIVTYKLRRKETNDDSDSEAVSLSENPTTAQ